MHKLPLNRLGVSCVLLLGVLAAGMAACSKQEELPVAETPRPVKTVMIDAPDVGGLRRFPGRIDALSKAELSFRIPGTIQELEVKEGDDVTSGDVLAEIETDKATMEVEAVDEGKIGKLLVAEGSDNVPVNQVIALLLGEDEDASALDGAGSAPPPAATPAPAPATRTPG